MRAECTKLITAAARLPARRPPANSQFDLSCSYVHERSNAKSALMRSRDPRAASRPRDRGCGRVNVASHNHRACRNAIRPGRAVLGGLDRRWLQASQCPFLHCLVLDGVYRCGADGAPEFVETGALSDDELHALLQTVITRLMKLLTRRGVLIEEMGQIYLAEPDADGEEARTLRPLQAAAVIYRIAFGPRAGRKLLTLMGAWSREDRTEAAPVCRHRRL
jgi:hypothetical protein